MNINTDNPLDPNRDRFILSKPATALQQGEAGFWK